jgi:hypothetical protein
MEVSEQAPEGRSPDGLYASAEIAHCVATRLICAERIIAVAPLPDWAWITRTVTGDVFGVPLVPHPVSALKPQLITNNQRPIPLRRLFNGQKTREEKTIPKLPFHVHPRPPAAVTGAVTVRVEVPLPLIELGENTQV